MHRHSPEFFSIVRGNFEQVRLVNFERFSQKFSIIICAVVYFWKYYSYSKWYIILFHFGIYVYFIFISNFSIHFVHFSLDLIAVLSQVNFMLDHRVIISTLKSKTGRLSSSKVPLKQTQFHSSIKRHFRSNFLCILVCTYCDLKSIDIKT